MANLSLASSSLTAAAPASLAEALARAEARLDAWASNSAAYTSLLGEATPYLLGASPVGLPSGRGLFHDSNASGTQNTGDELIAIIQGPNPDNALTGAVVL